LDELHRDNQAALEPFRREVREHPIDALGYYLLVNALPWAPTAESASSHSSHANEAIVMAGKATELNPRLTEAWDWLAQLSGLIQ
jgi:hypothetical protein